MDLPNPSRRTFLTRFSRALHAFPVFLERGDVAGLLVAQFPLGLEHEPRPGIDQERIGPRLPVVGPAFLELVEGRSVAGLGHGPELRRRWIARGGRGDRGTREEQAEE